MEKIAINRDISALIEQMVADKAADLPLWIELLPAGDPIVGRDGRSFNNPNPQGVINAFNDDTLDLPIDTEPATQLKAPLGDYSSAVGWAQSTGLVAGTWDIAFLRWVLSCYWSYYYACIK